MAKRSIPAAVLVAALVCLLSTKITLAEQPDPCTAATTPSDIQVTLSTPQTAYHLGEIVPLTLAFTSTTPHRYKINNANYDRSGRLGIDHFCLDPDTSDPLESYFRVGIFMGGGLFSENELSSKPNVAPADLNEFRRLPPGHYRLYTASYRVSLVNKKHPFPEAEDGLVLRSNTLEFDVLPVDRKWQQAQLEDALKTLAQPALDYNRGYIPRESDPRLHAARVLRFLNTEASTRQLAQIYGGREPGDPANWEFHFGLYSSPYRQLVLDAMHKELANPTHGISEDFLSTLANLEMQTDPGWEPTEASAAQPDYYKRRQAQQQELVQSLAEETLTNFAHKTGKARTITALGLITSGALNSSQTASLHPALVSGWKDLPLDTQHSLIQYQWSTLAGPSSKPGDNSDLLPLLLSLATPSHDRDYRSAELHNAALQHIYQIDPATATPLILRDLADPNAEPNLALLKLLQPQQISAAVPAAVDRIVGTSKADARSFDYAFIDRYADTSVLAPLQAYFEQNLGKESCAPQTSLLRSFLRVAPEYGAAQVAESLKTRKDTACYSTVLTDIGDRFKPAERTAVEALDDPNPDVAKDAAQALGRWGSSAAEAPLWARLERLHEEWTGRADEFERQSFPNPASDGNEAYRLEFYLISSLGTGTAWLATPEKLTHLQELTINDDRRHEIQQWLDESKQGPPIIQPNWNQTEEHSFNLLQSSSLTEEQLATKLALFPKGTTILWQFWPPGEISPPVPMELQEATFERVRSATEASGIILKKANHPDQPDQPKPASD